MLLREMVVKPLGDPLDIEGRGKPAGRVDDGEVVFFVEREDQMFELLDQRFARLASPIDVPTGSVRASRFPFDPLPTLGVPVARGEHDEMLVDGPGNRPLDPLPGGMVRESVGRICHTLISH